MEFFIAKTLFKFELGFSVAKWRRGAGDIGLNDQRIGLAQACGQPGRQGRHIDGAHMNAADQMQLAISR
ncbi:hypothetical protein D3C77_698750 [compost metagenome]